VSGWSMQLWPQAPAANKDRKYFPLGTCKSKPDLVEGILKENERFRSALAKMLGSEAAADAYIRNRDHELPIKGYR
jgi:hypothetical protein